MIDTTPFLILAITVQRTGHAIARRLADAVIDVVEHRHDDRGQATTEYALVLLAAALVALLVVAWATAGGGAARVSRLFNRVIDSVIDRV
jgi:Flp pilus assembly pilin Flp